MERLRLFYREELLESLKNCSKSASNALSMLVNTQVTPNLTSINLKPMQDLFMLPQDNIVIISDITGDMAGTMIVSFKADEGLMIINKMLNRDLNLIKDLEDEEIGVLKEYMNIVGGAFLTCFGNHFNLNVKAEIPSFEGKFSEIQEIMISQLKALNKRILFINSSMTVQTLKADAVFYVLFEEDSLNMVLNIISKGDDNPFEEV